MVLKVSLQSVHVLQALAPAVAATFFPASHNKHVFAPAAALVPGTHCVHDDGDGRLLDCE